MSKFDPYKLLPKERNKTLNEFYSIVVSLKTREQIINFFKDLLTASESIMLARRIQIAKMLLQGHGYLEISKELKTGIDTITRVQRWLKNGFGGYIKTLEKVVEKEGAEIRRKEDIEARKNVDPNSLEGLAYRYPLYWGLTHEIYQMLKGYNREKRGRRGVKKK
jgi:TrpR-related protein YerC/YecD